MTHPFPSPTKAWHTASYAAVDPSRPELSMAGKTVVITGGAGTIGTAIAQGFAEAGAANIILIGRTEKTLAVATSAIESKGSSISFEVADITDRESFTSTISALQSRHPIDIFINNAGYFPLPSPIISADMDDWWKGFEVNTRGSTNAIRAMFSQGNAKAIFINITAGFAHVPPVQGFSAYSISKLATAKFFEYLHAENPGLRVLNIHPGVVEGDMTARSKVPGMDEAQLPGNFVVWACSPEAEFLNGRFVWANWDVDELKARAKEIQGSSIFTTGLDGFP